MSATASHDGVTRAAPCPGCVLCDLCGLDVWRETSVSTVPCAPPVAPVDLSELANDLAAMGAIVAARLVREGRREYAPTIAEELRTAAVFDAGDAVTRAQVGAWGEGRDAAIIASNLAWRGDSDSNGCEACALAALKSGDAADRCKGCRPVVCA